LNNCSTFAFTLSGFEEIGTVMAVCKKIAATTGHPARDGKCEKIRAGIPAAARSVSQS
jgi:hypothetical protein